MNLLDQDPLVYFGRWTTEPVVPSDGRSVLSVMDALNRHPLARDESAQDHVMPAARYREKAGRFRIFEENQGTWHCFVRSGDELLDDPPVYFETCLDLKQDCGFPESGILDGNHVLACERFTGFLWFLLARHFCLRMEAADYFAPGVHGILSEKELVPDGAWVNPLGRNFPAGFTCYVGEGTLCVPGWGAAFLNDAARDRFLRRFDPVISGEWGRVLSE